MAEHVMAMTLALAKRLLVEDQKLRNGEFDQFTPNRALAGMTAGILGFGGDRSGNCQAHACVWHADLRDRSQRNKYRTSGLPWH